jgi:hypothetical protein
MQTKRTVVQGTPDPTRISTSLVERLNLTTRMSMRRFARRTNAHSKNLRHHKAAVALHFVVYNFCRIHQTLHTTPAIRAGIADHIWTVEELVAAARRPR